MKLSKFISWTVVLFFNKLSFSVMMKIASDCIVHGGVFCVQTVTGVIHSAIL